MKDVLINSVCDVRSTGGICSDISDNEPNIRELEFQQIKSEEFNILKHLDLFCKENRIKYFLSNGTLLGAVKYKGFIPWDDDIDILVPRTDYDRLIAEFQDTERYKLFSVERTQDYRFPFAKLCDMTTRKEEDNIDNGVALGLDIDIFPLDCCTEHMLKKSVFAKLRICQTGCILSKFQSTKGKPFYKKIIIKLCRLVGYSFFLKRLVRLVKKESALGETYKGCLTWPIYGERELIPVEVFADTVEVEFEGCKFPAPIGYDTYLRSLYGDYRQDPPLDKQKTHHSFKVYRID